MLVVVVNVIMLLYNIDCLAVELDSLKGLTGNRSSEEAHREFYREWQSLILHTALPTDFAPSVCRPALLISTNRRP